MMEEIAPGCRTSGLTGEIDAANLLCRIRVSFTPQVAPSHSAALFPEPRRNFERRPADIPAGSEASADILLWEGARFVITLKRNATA